VIMDAVSSRVQHAAPPTSGATLECGLRKVYVRVDGETVSRGV